MQSPRLLARQASQLQVDFADPVGREHTRASAVGHNRQPPAHSAIARSQTLCGGKQRHKGAHPHRTGTPQGRIKHVVAANNGARMGQRCHVTRRLAARLEHDDRLGVGGSAQSAHETTRIADAFEVDHDAVRLRISRQKIEYLRHVHVSIRSERDNG